MISSRGTKVYPPTGLSPDGVGLVRARFVTRDEACRIDPERSSSRPSSRRASWTHVEKLHVFSGHDGFTKAQGQ